MLTIKPDLKLRLFYFELRSNIEKHHSKTVIYFAYFVCLFVVLFVSFKFYMLIVLVEIRHANAYFFATFFFKII